MSHSMSLCNEQVSPLQIWGQLNVEYQLKITRLLAQLALNLVLAQSEPFSSLMEVNHAIPAQRSKSQA